MSQLIEAKQKAEESSQLKTAFLSNLSHYIRSPLNSILGFIELLQVNDESEQNRDLFYGYISERSQHLLQTLSSILEISKLQQGLLDVDFKEFHLNDAMKKTTDSVRLDIVRLGKDVEIQESFGFKTGEDIVCSDQMRIQQILASLLENAVNFTEKGPINVFYSLVNKDIVICVQDSGTGIPPEKQLHLFSEFMATSSYVCNVNEGAGLGLYLSTGIAKLLKGRLWLEETGVNGSLFCFSFPRGMMN